MFNSSVRSLHKLLGLANSIWTNSFGLALISWCSVTQLASAQSAEATVPDAPPRLPAADSIEFYSLHIQPLLEAACYDCHSHKSGESNGLLMVDSGAAMAVGGTRGASIVAGKPDSSPLYKALLYTDSDLQMPPDRKLSDEQILLIKTWIVAGAVAPKTDHDPVGKPPVPTDPKNHWAYQSPKATFHADEAALAIDSILQNRLQENGLTFSPPAGRRTLLRRLSFDLIGMTPTFDELERFVKDNRPDSVVISEAIDTLLASSHFGERWARHWMDISRYADTKGYVFQEDRQYAEAYRYRDWLIQSLNQDMPYTEFVRKQLAADLDVDEQGDGTNHLPALGFLTLGRRFLNNRHDIIDDRLDVITRGLMGMTLACARCHDHKYDPVSQADYYALSGVFLNTDEPGGEPFAHRLVDAEKERESRILVRGNPSNPGDKVSRRFVTFLAPDEVPFGAGSGRRDLADQITHPENPLTARVLVNRLWMHLMGSSLVESPSDLGTRCPPPLHQDLLDQMAVDFQHDQWSIKRLIRRIVLSRAYQQQSVARGEAVNEAMKSDPNNTLYWRMNRRRRDIESLRDGLLAASGQLDLQLLGPSVKVDRSPFPKRRTVYAYIDRQDLVGFLRNFDMASPDAHSPSRAYTSVPQQGLYLLNSDFVAEQAAALGRQAATISDENNQQIALNWLFQKILGRVATQPEAKLVNGFLTTETSIDRVAQRWIAGFGTLNLDDGSLTSFEPLPKFHEGRWSGADGAPDTKLGWCLIHAQGGHPGSGLEFSVVRRWIAPRDGTVHLQGKLNHPAAEGDGVRGTVVINGNQRVGQWTVFHGEARTDIQSIDVAEGQTIDLITDCLSNPNHDSFNWTVTIRYQDGDRESYESDKQLPTPVPQPLDSWQLLAQAILASNEFAFID